VIFNKLIDIYWSLIMKNSVFKTIGITTILGLGAVSTISLAATKSHEFYGYTVPLKSSKTILRSNAGNVPAYAVRVNNDSTFHINATAYGNGGSKNYPIDPYYAAVIENNFSPPGGYRIVINTDRGQTIYDGYLQNLSCIDIYSGSGQNYKITTNCLQA